MKHLITAILAFASILLSACTSTDAVKEVRGYPVYKFINFGGINTFNKIGSEKLLGENYDDYVEHQQLFVSHGFQFISKWMNRIFKIAKPDSRSYFCEKVAG